MVVELVCTGKLHCGVPHENRVPALVGGMEPGSTAEMAVAALAVGIVAALMELASRCLRQCLPWLLALAVASLELTCAFVPRDPAAVHIHGEDLSLPLLLSRWSNLTLTPTLPQEAWPFLASVMAHTWTGPAYTLPTVHFCYCWNTGEYLRLWPLLLQVAVVYAVRRDVTSNRLAPPPPTPPAH